MLRNRVLPALLLTVLVLSISAAELTAQSRTVFWRAWDVAIDNVDVINNRYDVSEQYDVEFTGSFSFGSRVIEQTNLTGISNIRVSQDGRPLQQACSNAAGTYCVSRSGNEVSITYYFLSPINNGDASFHIDYTVQGALRVYEGGDQLYWMAIPQEHFGFSIGSSTVTVDLPAGYGPREGIDPVVSYGAPTNVAVNGTQVVFTTTQPLGANDYLEVRVQFPHNPDAVAPAWQSGFDSRRAFEETTQPIIALIAILVSLLLAIAGPLLVYTRWQAKGRDPNIGPVPEYLSEPPSDLPPALVGSLIDERADVRDVMSTIIDLGHRGYLVIEEEQTEGLFGIGRSSSFTFKRTDKDIRELRPFEQRVMTGVFNGQMQRTLDSLKNRFYTVIPRVQSDLYNDMVREGLFDRNPQTTRQTWMAGGALLMAIAFFGIFIGAPFLADVTPVLLCLPFAVGITGLSVLVGGNFMVAKTRKGAEEAAKWNAFQEYLRNLEKYGNVEGAVANFDRYLPYAVAFGLDKSWMAKFRQVDTMPVPPWYYPTYMGGPYGRGYRAGTPLYRGGGRIGDAGSGMPGELARAPGPGMSMEGLSDSMRVSMENLSSGLSSMMESATRAMTSQPQSSGSSGSWGGGGRSFSGGGSRGGGSSGGGRSGFG